MPRMTEEPMLSFVSIQRTRATVSMDQSAQRQLSMLSTALPRLTESALSTRSSTSRRLSRRETAKLSACARPSSTKVQRRDAISTSKASQRTSPSRDLEISSLSLERLRVSSYTQLAKESKSYTPLSASKSQMKPPPPRRSFTTRCSKEEP